MVKISALAAGTALRGSEEIPATQSGVTNRITPSQIADYIGGVTGYYNVKDYGAVGDGATNDTVAIQQAMDSAGGAGGGVVFFPAGDYIVQPAALVYQTAALFVRYSNLHIRGASRYASKLTLKLYDGDDPATDFDLAGGLVQRGFIFRISDDLGTITSVKFSELEFDGSAGYQVATPGNPPANPGTGNGWDITHMAIHANGDAIDEWIVEDCYFHSFRGENIYNGGSALDLLIIRNCRFDDGNGNLVSTSCGRSVIEGNEFSNAYQGIENSYQSSLNIIRNNHFHDIDHGGVHTYPSTSGVDSRGFAEVYNNQFFRVIGNAVLAPGGRNMRIFGNLFVDCFGANITLSSPGGGGSAVDTIQMFNCEIFNNTFLRDDYGVSGSGQIGGVQFSLDDAAYPPHNLRIHDNFQAQTYFGNASGATNGGNFWDHNSTVAMPGARIDQNYNIGGQADDDLAGSPTPGVLTSGAEQTWGSVLSHMDNTTVRVIVAYRVETNCNLRIRARYREAGGTMISEDLINAAVVANTSGHFFWSVPASNTTSGLVDVLYTVDVANAVFGKLHIDRYY